MAAIAANAASAKDGILETYWNSCNLSFANSGLRIDTNFKFGLEAVGPRNKRVRNPIKDTAWLTRKML